MNSSTDVPVIIASAQDSEDGGYVSASDGRIKAKLRTLTGVATEDVAKAIASIASAFDRATLPDSVPTLRVALGLTLSGELGVGIAGAGVDADVTVEFEWRK